MKTVEGGWGQLIIHILEKHRIFLESIEYIISLCPDLNKMAQKRSLLD